MSLKVMIVDDSPLDRDRAIEALRNTELEVVAEASTGIEAVTRYRKFRPDLVLMDLLMPQMNGIEAARAILQYDKEATIIPVTGLHQESVRTEAADVGMRGFVRKPITREALLAEIRSCLGAG
jgi:two-component system chemotaxis response regulator CheY